MTRFDDLDRALDAYFDLETAAPEPAGLLEAVTVATRARRPRPSWLAWIRQGGPTGSGAQAPDASQWVLMIAIAALLLAMVAAVALVGGQRSSLNLVSRSSPSPSSPAEPSGSPSAAPSPSLYPIAAGEPWIAYMSNIADDGTDRLHLVRPDGSGRHQLVTGLDSRQEEHPDWAPDGSTIAFERWIPDATYPQLDRLEIWTIRADGSNATRTVACDLPCLQLSAPAWSPDGREIAFLRYDIVSPDVFGPTAIEIVDVATGMRRVVLESTDGTTAYYRPRWSPDGSRIVFGLETYTDATASSLASARIAIIPVDGSPVEPTIISPVGVDSWEPDWHPTDDRILFRTRFDPSDPIDRTVPTDVWVVRSDGSEATNLSNLGLSEVRAIEPTWTPDGTRIVFTQVDRIRREPDPGGRVDGRGWHERGSPGIRGWDRREHAADALIDRCPSRPRLPVRRAPWKRPVWFGAP